MPGLTAYSSLKRIAEPIKAGETAYVSAASGAVGQARGGEGEGARGTYVSAASGAVGQARGAAGAAV